MDFKIAKESMVNNQLRPNKIYEKSLLDLFMTIDKELFLPEDIKSIAYIDDDIYLNESRYYLSNLQIAQLIQNANLKKSDKVLHIGGLSGYVSLILSKMVSKVFIIEKDKNLFETLNNNLKNNNINNITLLNKDHETGYSLAQPYDVIFIDSVVEVIPKNLKDQLISENGRLITIEKVNNNLGKGIKITKNNTSYFKEILFDSLSNLSSIFKKKITFEL